MITISVVGMPGTSTTAASVAEARTKALALARIYSQHWVHALDEDAKLVHLIEPRSIVDDSDPVEPIEVIADQLGMFE